MLDLILVMAKHMPKEELAKQLRIACDQYIGNQTELNWSKVVTFAVITLGKDALQDKSIQQVINEQEETERIQARMNSKS